MEGFSFFTCTDFHLIFLTLARSLILYGYLYYKHISFVGGFHNRYKLCFGDIETLSCSHLAVSFSPLFERNETAEILLLLGFTLAGISLIHRNFSSTQAPFTSSGSCLPTTRCLIACQIHASPTHDIL